MTGAFTWLYRTMGLEPRRAASLDPAGTAGAKKPIPSAEMPTSPTQNPAINFRTESDSDQFDPAYQYYQYKKQQRAMQQYIRNRNDAKYQADLEARSGCNDE